MDGWMDNWSRRSEDGSRVDLPCKCGGLWAFMSHSDRPLQLQTAGLSSVTHRQKETRTGDVPAHYVLLKSPINHLHSRPPRSL